MSSIKRVAIIYRPETPKALSLAREVVKWLDQRGVEAFSFSEQKSIAGTTSLKTTQQIARLDLAVVLGGDGTYLIAVRLLKGRQVPMLGINLGSLGFLTETRISDLYDVLEMALAKKLEVCSRSMLSIRVRRGKKITKEYLALNDLVVERGAMSQLIKLAIHSEKFLVSTVKADGLIIATPTGSTAYNLAAGGPILHPEARAIVVTSVCPHSLTNRPLIFPDDRVLRFQVCGEGRKAFMSVDGRKVGEITEKDRVEVERAQVDHLKLHVPGHNDFDLLREKLRFGQRD